MMSMRRMNAKNYMVYLTRRVEDFIDPARPAPKWTDLDRDAVRELVREFRYLEQCYDLAVHELRFYDLELPLPVDAESGEEFSAWDLQPQQSQRSRPWWRFWERS